MDIIKNISITNDFFFRMCESIIITGSNLVNALFRCMNILNSVASFNRISNGLFF